MNLMLLGAIAVTSLVIALFFLRFWKETGDRFFLFFAISFFVDRDQSSRAWLDQPPG